MGPTTMRHRRGSQRSSIFAFAGQHQIPKAALHHLPLCLCLTVLMTITVTLQAVSLTHLWCVIAWMRAPSSACTSLWTRLQGRVALAREVVRGVVDTVLRTWKLNDTSTLTITLSEVGQLATGALYVTAFFVTTCDMRFQAGQHRMRPSFRHSVCV